MENGRSVIDPEKCVKCGSCINACEYNAIIRQERPCVKACEVGAIGMDSQGRAEIDQEKCVSCGMCLVSCPFVAIVDKGQIYQTIKAMQSDVQLMTSVGPGKSSQRRCSSSMGSGSMKRMDSSARGLTCMTRRT